MFTRILILLTLFLIYHRLGAIMDELSVRPMQHTSAPRTAT